MNDFILKIMNKIWVYPLRLILGSKENGMYSLNLLTEPKYYWNYISRMNYGKKSMLEIDG